MNKWDQKFMTIAELIATWSKDPSTKVGCVIVDLDHNQLAGGYNGFPRNVVDDFRLEQRELKLRIIVHAEANAISSAARNGHSLKNSIAYITLPPCAQCAALLIQTGVSKVVFKSGHTPSKWEWDWSLAKQIFDEAGVSYVEI